MECILYKIHEANSFLKRSFGDYFKEEAIDMAWKCLTEEFKLNPDRLYATYFGGDESSPCDDEAREIWLKYLPANRILPFDAKDNFWEMGATGPCGPCTEIHYDRIGGRDASKLVNADLPDVIEIWNNVFIQFNREADRSLRPLPAQHIDTGMGMERLVSILQNVDSNYDTDIFLPLFARIQELTGAESYTGRIGKEDVGYKDMAYRVVADHIRTLSFAIADGATPSNEGRGYVLRRVLRRAVRYGRQNLGAELGFFCQLVPALVNHMGNTFPELKEKEAHITNVIQDEEESFGRTLDKGLTKFTEMAQRSVDGIFSADDAHFLYTTMGFPADLTELMAEEVGLKLDMEGFEEKMKAEQELSQAAHKAKMSAGSGKDMRLVAEQTSTLVGKGVGATDDAAKYMWHQDLEGCVTKAIFLGRNETEDKIGFVESASSENGTIGLILDKSSFYAEAGGQIYDTGTIVSSNGGIIEIENVQLYGQFVLHIGKVIDGTFCVGDSVICKVDYERRGPIASNHTMTHVLNYALREVLITRPAKEGSTTSISVDQKGSLVDETKFRFDFSWNGPLTLQQLKEVEAICQDRIDNAVPVEAYVAPLESAQKISSLRAVFGEAYPDPVRVVSVGAASVQEMLANPQDSTWNEFSVEFCGGTHLTNTKEAQAFVLLSEEGIAKGIRRVVGFTKSDALQAQADASTLIAKVETAGKLEGEALEDEVKILTNEVNAAKVSVVVKMELREILSDFSKRVIAFNKQKAAAQTEAIVEKAIKAAEATDGNKVVLHFDFGIDGKIAKNISAAFFKKCKDKALLLISGDANTDRVMVVAAAPKGLDVDCKAWVDMATEGMGGKGGGKKDSAQTTLDGYGNLNAILNKAV
jgi:alanyl-tRNA synthetase